MNKLEYMKNVEQLKSLRNEKKNDRDKADPNCVHNKDFQALAWAIRELENMRAKERSGE